MSWFASHKKPLLITLGIVGVTVVAVVTWIILKMIEPKGSAAMHTDTSQVSSQPVTSPATLDSGTSTTIDSLQNSLKANSTDDTALDDALNDSNQQVTVPTE